MDGAKEVRVIQLSGHVRTGETLDRLRTELESAQRNGESRIVLNMSGVRSMDSSCIGLLVRHMTLAKNGGGALRLASVPAGAVQALQITGLLRLFQVFPNEEAAVASFDGAQG